VGELCCSLTTTTEQCGFRYDRIQKRGSKGEATRELEVRDARQKPSLEWFQRRREADEQLNGGQEKKQLRNLELTFRVFSRTMRNKE
jgi:hypothetical protein